MDDNEAIARLKCQNGPCDACGWHGDCEIMYAIRAITERSAYKDGLELIKKRLDKILTNLVLCAECQHKNTGQCPVSGELAVGEDEFIFITPADMKFCSAGIRNKDYQYSDEEVEK